MILIALGSNLGDREDYLKQACTAMEAAGIRILKRSSIIEVAAMMPVGAPAEWNRPFLNQVIEVGTDADPHSLLASLKTIEGTLGRQQRKFWAPREIDLDLIAYHDMALDTPTLKLPHPHLKKRVFVLKPLAEIAPNWRHPLLKQSAQELLSVLLRPKLVAILNVTPDSFSGDGRTSAKEAFSRFQELAEAGADIIDIGAESTRPGATPLSANEEWARLEPLLKMLPSQRPKISIDTRHAETARRALAMAMGMDIINDVSGLSDKEMVKVLAEASCPVIVMHSLTIPADPTVTLPPGADPVKTILQWKADVSNRGIEPSCLIYDPGIGFGKTAQQSLALIERASDLVASGGNWLFGHSRKSFMKLLSDVPADKRDALTLDVSQRLAGAGVQYLRVHDIASHAEWLKRAA